MQRMLYAHSEVCALYRPVSKNYKKQEMKNIILISILFLISSNLFTQTKGGFDDFNEFKENKPSLTFDFIIKQRTNGNVFMTGGITNYRLKKIKPESYVIKVKEEIWGVYVGDSIYINSYPYSKRKGYNKLLEIGYYSYFIGEPAGGELEQRKLGFIEPNEKPVRVCCKVGYVLFEDGQIKLLTPTLLLDLTADKEEMNEKVKAENFKRENVPEMFEILSKYNMMRK